MACFQRHFRSIPHVTNLDKVGLVPNDHGTEYVFRVEITETQVADLLIELIGCQSERRDGRNVHGDLPSEGEQFLCIA